MNRWGTLAVGVVAIALALLLIRSPPTGHHPRAPPPPPPLAPPSPAVQIKLAGG
jgi:hypothetical protein